jgi:hypothetical protein
MRNLTGPWSLCTIALAVLAGQAGAGERMPAQEAAQLLKADIPLVRLYEAGSRITRVYGQPLAFGLAPEDSAEQFLLSYAEVFGVTPDQLELAGFPGGDYLVQPLMFEQDTGDYKFFLLRYIEQQDGVPVFRSDLRLLVRNQPDFPLVLAASSLRDLGDFTVDQGTLRSDFNPAQHIAKDFDTFTEPETVIWAGAEDEVVEPRLAYTFVAQKGTPQDDVYEKWLYVVDAATGEILFRENRIIFTDITGSVSGMATTIPKSAPCNPEVLTPMPWATVQVVGGATAWADENGDFVVASGGSGEVTVESLMSGRYFFVDNVAGDEETLPMQVTPPGPADFTHNADNSDELVRAQVNGYLQANVVRDFVLTHSPSYPVIASQINFPVYVNRVDGYCPGNAWYDYSSINFCRAASGYPNTAWSSVIHHEYGHHLVDCGGSGQDQYGEGMADCMSMLIADDPILGYGFYGDCDTGLRNADNDYQYPCSGEAHDCGQLLSGCVWSTRNELLVTFPDDYLDIISNLTVNSVPLHSGSTITPQITIDFLTLDDTDGDIYNGTPHAAEICAGFGAHNMDCPEITFDPIGFEYPEGRPDMVAPGQQTAFPVHVVPLTGTPVASTGQLHYRLDEGDWVAEAMTETAPNEYEAVLPAASCDSSFRWYVSAEAAGEGTFTHPSGAPDVAFYVPVATGTAVLFEDDFETDQGWAVEAGADTGDWERADPEGVDNYGEITQPEDDHTPTGTLCYVTGPLAGSGAGSYDVDGGPSRLTSPVLDLSNGGGTVSYWRWFHISTQWDDELVVEVSNDDGANWVIVETVADRQTWTYVEWSVGDYVTPTAQMRVRFTVDDSPNNSLLEALIDDFGVTALVCDEVECPGDLDGDGYRDLSDLAQLLSNYGMSGGASYEDGDLDADGDVDLSDLATLLGVYGVPCP